MRHNNVLRIWLLAVASVGCADETSSVGPRGAGKGSCVGAECEATAASYFEQGWTEAERAEFYQTSHGAFLLPKAWFDALDPLSVPGLAQRIGWVAGPDGLPVGMALYQDPLRGPGVGLTCAACHTQEFQYQGQRYRVDGGAGMIDVGALVGAILSVVVAADDDGPNYAAFEQRLLGPGASETQKQELAQQFAMLAGPAKENLASLSALVPVEPGYGRLDALNFTFNFLFGALDEANLHPASAPVSTPSLWDTGRFNWTHYSASTRMRLARDVVNALGAGARFGFEGGEVAHSSVPLPAIQRLEALVDRLEPPAWPEKLFGAIDRGLAKQGQSVFQRVCASCHVPGENEEGELELTLVDAQRVGTDPAYIAAINDQTVDLSALGVGDQNAGDSSNALNLMRAAQLVTDKIIAAEIAAADPPLSQAEARRYNEGRVNDWRAVRAYKAIPLAGIWSTAPYLHNGSVPTLAQLLLPADRRSSAPFYINSPPTFDPVNVGFADREGFVFDPAVPGNANRGHDGDGYLVCPAAETDRKQCIAERRALLEYLKTL